MTILRVGDTSSKGCFSPCFFHCLDLFLLVMFFLKRMYILHGILFHHHSTHHSFGSDFFGNMGSCSTCIMMGSASPSYVGSAVTKLDTSGDV